MVNGMNLDKQKILVCIAVVLGGLFGAIVALMVTFYACAVITVMSDARPTGIVIGLNGVLQLSAMFLGGVVGGICGWRLELRSRTGN